MNKDDRRDLQLLISVAGNDGATRTEVWGTPGVDPCEDDAWNAIDIDAAMAEFGASSIIVNGPRYFVVDGTATRPRPEAGVWVSLQEVPWKHATSATSP